MVHDDMMQLIEFRRSSTKVIVYTNKLITINHWIHDDDDYVECAHTEYFSMIFCGPSNFTPSNVKID
jgi:hypothetical protein